MTRRDFNITRITAVTVTILAGVIGFVVCFVGLRWADLPTAAEMAVIPVVMVASVFGGRWLAEERLTAWALRHWGSR